MNIVGICGTPGRNINIRCYREKIEGQKEEDGILGPSWLLPWYRKSSYLPFRDMCFLITHILLLAVTSDCRIYNLQQLWTKLATIKMRKWISSQFNSINGCGKQIVRFSEVKVIESLTVRHGLKRLAFYFVLIYWTRMVVIFIINWSILQKDSIFICADGCLWLLTLNPSWNYDGSIHVKRMNLNETLCYWKHDCLVKINEDHPTAKWRKIHQ